MTLEKIAELLADKVGVDASTVTLDTTFDEIGLDSLDIVEMLMGLEEEFGIEVSEDEAVALRTVGDIVAVIDAKK